MEMQTPEQFAQQAADRIIARYPYRPNVGQLRDLIETEVAETVRQVLDKAWLDLLK